MKISIETEIRYFSEVYEIIKIVDFGKSRNIKMVKIKKDRHCTSCNNLLSKGSEVLTINKRISGRNWYCKKCQLDYIPEEGEHLVGYYTDGEVLYFSNETTKWGNHLSEDEIMKDPIANGILDIRGDTLNKYINLSIY